MQRLNRLNARLLSLVLSVAMVITMTPVTAFATEGDSVPLGVSSVGAIQSFDKLEDRFIPSVGENAPDHVYGLPVELGTAEEDLQLPQELTAMVTKTAVAVTDGKANVTTTQSESIAVEWNSDKEYNADENGQFIYTAVLPEGYILADGVHLPQIYVVVGSKQARSGNLIHDISTGVLTLMGSCTCSAENPHIVSGSTTNYYIFVFTGEHWLTLNNVSIDASSTMHESLVVSEGATANLTLADNTTNTLKGGSSRAGLQVPANATVVIGGSGTLNATGGTSTPGGYGGAAGIGGAAGGAGGDISITGGTINATGSDDGAGIGGGNGGAGGIISITGGIVTATSGEGAAGIGGGNRGAGGDISITDGTVTATGAAGGAGIGGGYQGAGNTISITGGTVAATGGMYGAGIGGGIRGAGGTISITGDTVTAQAGEGCSTAVGSGLNGAATTSLTLTNAIVTYKTNADYTGETNIANNKIYEGTTQDTEATDVKIVGGTNTLDHDISTGALVLGDLCTCTAETPHVISGSTTSESISASAGEHWVTLNNVSIDVSATTHESFIIAGDAKVNLTLADGTTNILKGGQGYAGLQVPVGATVVIGGSGTLNATGTLDRHLGGSAGIGSDCRGAAGTISITGGTINATGSDEGAGIGNGSYQSGGTISISGGIVTANAGVGAAGIGGGFLGRISTGCTISITDGIVTANGGSNSAGIGGGAEGAGGTISITGGIVTATGSTHSAGIGGGADGTPATSLTLTGMTVKYKVDDSYTGTTNIANNRIYEGTTQDTEATKVKVESGTEIIVGGTDPNYPATAAGLQKAFTDIPDGSTVKIAADIDLETTTVSFADKTVTLDLNGNEISFSGFTAGAIKITGSGGLTVTDTSSGKDGKIMSVADSQRACVINHSGSGVLTIAAGTVTTQKGNAIFIPETCAGTINISGGSVTATAEYGAAILCFAGTINVSAGTVSAISGNTVSIGVGTLLTVTGGTVSSDTGMAINMPYPDSNSSKIIISGADTLVTSGNADVRSGTIYVASAASPATCVLEINDATVSNTVDGYAVYFGSDEVTSDNLSGYYTNNGGTVGKVKPEPRVIRTLRTKPLLFTGTSIEKQEDATSWGNPQTEDIDAMDVEGWAWRHETRILTLNGLNLLTAEAIAVALPAATFINIEGSNTISNADADASGSGAMCAAIDVKGSLTVTGPSSATLTATAGKLAGGSSYGINCEGNLDVIGCNLIGVGAPVSGMSRYSYGVMAKNEITVAAKLTGNGGEVADGAISYGVVSNMKSITLMGTSVVSGIGQTKAIMAYATIKAPEPTVTGTDDVFISGTTKTLAQNSAEPVIIYNKKIKPPTPPTGDDDDSYSPPSGGLAGGVTTPGKDVIDNPVGNQGSTNVMTEAVKNALATGKTSPIVYTNFANYTALTKDGLKAINDATAAATAGKNIQLNTRVQLDKKVGNAVISRITVNAATLATVMPDKLSLGVWFDQKQDKQVIAVKEKFERAFDNNMVIVTFEQKDPLKVNMEFAAKPDLSKLNTKTLYFYSYNPTTNLYYRIWSPNYWVDKNGYTHFTAPFGGSVVITDKPLTKK